MKRQTRFLTALAGVAVLTAAPAGAATIIVNPGESIQTAIDGALPGDTIEVQPGTYNEDIDFGGKAVTVVGTGPDTVLQGTGAGPVVRFESGETSASVLDSMTITGGDAITGGGINIVSSSPTILRNIVHDNVARQRGSGIYLNDSQALISNNLVMYNRNSAGDPHGIQLTDSDATVVNNSIIRNDSNGIFLIGSTAADVRNNLIARNGSKGRGRGICDFSGGASEIHYSLFWKNRASALLTNGQDFGKIRRAQLLIGAPRIVGNVDGNPEMFLRKPPKIDSKKLATFTIADLAAMLRPNPAGKRMRAIDAGDPDPVYDDRDGTRNDIGFTGGPESPLW